MKAGTLLILIFTLFISTGLSQYTGKVYLDSNQNQEFDSGEELLEGVRVSDGLNVFATDEKGQFDLPGTDRTRFIFITIPSAYRCDQFYIRAQGTEISYDFALEKYEKGDRFSFIHIADTETPDGTRWVDMLRDYAKHEDAAFIIHTGDICYEPGMRFHAKEVNTQTMGVPTFYCVGNHDLVKGDYGEQLYEELFGPVFYSFEMGDVHFISTPMLRGDYKPSYTKEDVYRWLKNDLAMAPKEMPKIIFNHDLLTGEDEFIYRINAEEEINLNEYNLKAWVYGHWHNHFYRPHGNSGVVSICTAVANRGGIDHSLSAFRVFHMQADGIFSTDLVYSYIDHELNIVSPAPSTWLQQSDKLPILVNTYNSAAPTQRVQYLLSGDIWSPLEQKTNWTWTGEASISSGENPEIDSMEIKVRALYGDGDEAYADRKFVARTRSTPEGEMKLDDWPNFLFNAKHDAGKIQGPTAPLELSWATNVGSNIHMCSPIVAEGKVFIASYDDGDARNCYVYAHDAISGEFIWKYKTENSVKSSIAYEDGKVFATDMLGNVYALKAEDGSLEWHQKLDLKVLPAYVSGTTVTNGVVYTGEGRGFWALKAEDGNVIWKNSEWNQGVGGPATPTVGDSAIIVSSNWNHLYGHDKSTGKLLWKIREKGLSFRDAAPAYKDGKLYLASGKHMFVLDEMSGEILQEKETGFGHKTNSTPLVTDSLIIMGTGAEGMVALFLHSLETAWQFKTEPSLTMSVPYSEPMRMTIETSPVRVGENIFFGASDGVFYCVELKTGELVWKMKLGAPILSTVAVSGEYIYIADIGGNLYSFGSK